MENISPAIETLIISEITGTISQEEKEILDLLIAVHPEVANISKHLHKKLGAVTIPKTDIDAIITSITNEINNVETLPAPSYKNNSRRRWYTIAGTTLAAAAVTAFIWFRPGNTSNIPSPHLDKAFFANNQKAITLTYGTAIKTIMGQGLSINEKGVITTDDGQVFDTEILPGENASVAVPDGGSYQLKLSDGTQIVMNSKTTATFPLIFGNRRNLTLAGEAYIEAAEDATKPFVVYAADTETKALGTAFNINSYKTGNVVVSLLKGKVRVSGGGQEKEITPGNAAIYSEGNIEISPNKKDLLDWAKGKIYLRTTNTQEIEETAARYLDLRIKFDKPITGKLARIAMERNNPEKFLKQFPAGYDLHPGDSTYYLR
ncbi:FecR family protein [Chitinophaga pinensis]|uniref:Anti-FecI sigma factor, FecR n=1 Tax=Chitinophaga pinensis (strain ATCC 43595 / DSM 2588 / LMG 13176 / NBRC 15968 / NCIMB 11800 / UQM 2034) TaxID=485918 RepID=A0A979GNI4_CHIPD|nr:FecR domain-containing protein [Chitinophaga pinensis]ACU59587.1 anti-FecI sigma factor, FecR [Chitinophaga pinensis DSM 2588]